MLVTQFFAEFYGFFLLIFGISMFVHKQMYMDLIHDMEHHRAVIYVLSIVGLIMGILTIMLHNVWSGDLLAVIITIVGWVATIKSGLYLALPNSTIHKIIHALGLVRNYHLYTIITLIVGIYLTINGILIY